MIHPNVKPPVTGEESDDGLAHLAHMEPGQLEDFIKQYPQLAAELDANEVSNGHVEVDESASRLLTRGLHGMRGNGANNKEQEQQHAVAEDVIVEETTGGHKAAGVEQEAEAMPVSLWGAVDSSTEERPGMQTAEQQSRVAHEQVRDMYDEMLEPVNTNQLYEDYQRALSRINKRFDKLGSAVGDDERAIAIGDARARLTRQYVEQHLGAGQTAWDVPVGVTNEVFRILDQTPERYQEARAHENTEAEHERRLAITNEAAAQIEQQQAQRAAGEREQRNRELALQLRLQRHNGSLVEAWAAGEKLDDLLPAAKRDDNQSGSALDELARRVKEKEKADAEEEVEPFVEPDIRPIAEDEEPGDLVEVEELNTTGDDKSRLFTRGLHGNRGVVGGDLELVDDDQTGDHQDENLPDNTGSWDIPFVPSLQPYNREDLLGYAHDVDPKNPNLPEAVRELLVAQDEYARVSARQRGSHLHQLQAGNRFQRLFNLGHVVHNIRTGHADRVRRAARRQYVSAVRNFINMRVRQQGATADLHSEGRGRTEQRSIALQWALRDDLENSIEHHMEERAEGESIGRRIGRNIARHWFDGEHHRGPLRGRRPFRLLGSTALGAVVGASGGIVSAAVGWASAAAAPVTAVVAGNAAKRGIARQANRYAIATTAGREEIDERRDVHNDLAYDAYTREQGFYEDHPSQYDVTRFTEAQTRAQAGANYRRNQIAYWPAFVGGLGGFALGGTVAGWFGAGAGAAANQAQQHSQNVAQATPTVSGSTVTPTTPTPTPTPANGLAINQAHPQAPWDVASYEAGVHHVAANQVAQYDNNLIQHGMDLAKQQGINLRKVQHGAKWWVEVVMKNGQARPMTDAEQAVFDQSLIQLAP